MERLKAMKERLMSCVESQMGDLSKTNAENGNFVPGAHLVVRNKDLDQIGEEVITEDAPVSRFQIFKPDF